MKEKKDKDMLPHMTPLQGPFHNIGISMTDPLGTYTGVPMPPDDIPEQDADDL